MTSSSASSASTSSSISPTTALPQERERHTQDESELADFFFRQDFLQDLILRLRAHVVAAHDVQSEHHLLDASSGRINSLVALVQYYVGGLVESLEQTDDVASVAGDHLHDLVDEALQHRRHRRDDLSLIHI